MSIYFDIYNLPKFKILVYIIECKIHINKEENCINVKIN